MPDELAPPDWRDSWWAIALGFLITGVIILIKAAMIAGVISFFGWILASIGLFHLATWAVFMAIFRDVFAVILMAVFIIGPAAFIMG